MLIYSAPVQGHTDAAWRHFHAEIFGGADRYFSPFVRLEKGELRSKDIKDLTSPLNDNTVFVPQVIFKNGDELKALVGLVASLGFKKIDLNMGCPFPLQTARGRGCASIGNLETVKAAAELVNSCEDIEFSLKMRLGLNGPDEWKETADLINSMRLDHVTVHPRYGKQQYGGTVNLDSFGEIYETIHHKIIYNGDIQSPADAKTIIERFPKLAGIMLGRGLLSRPTLACEIRESKELGKDERLSRLLNFHTVMLEHYTGILQGDGQVLSKIKPFWDYSEEIIGRKPYKLIKKAVSMPKYLSAIARIGQE